MKGTFYTTIVVLLLVSFMVIGCATKQESQAAWFSVTKSPVQLVYIGKGDEMDADLMYQMLCMARDEPYKNYKFNKKLAIELDALSNKNHKSKSETILNVSTSRDK